MRRKRHVSHSNFSINNTEKYGQPSLHYTPHRRKDNMLDWEHVYGYGLKLFAVGWTLQVPQENSTGISGCMDSPGANAECSKSCLLSPCASVRGTMVTYTRHPPRASPVRPPSPDAMPHSGARRLVKCLVHNAQVPPHGIAEHY